jgi:hypothetical protein
MARGGRRDGPPEEAIAGAEGIAEQQSAVIASQRVGAKRRPMTGSAKQSKAAIRKCRWIASSLRLLAMTMQAEPSALFDQIVLEDRHLELEGAVVVFVVDKEHADEFLADIDLG